MDKVHMPKKIGVVLICRIWGSYSGAVVAYDLEFNIIIPTKAQSMSEC